MLNIDGVLRWLALEMALVNGDGYWTRASDYNIYLDTKGVFHIIPHDANETFGPGGGARHGTTGGPGGLGRRRATMGPPPGRHRAAAASAWVDLGGGPNWIRSSGLNDATKPLRSKLLAVPTLRARYLTYSSQIATKWLDWNTLGPLAQKYQALIAADVQKDTRKLDTFEAFQAGVNTLKAFADQRRAYLLSYK